MAHLTVMIPPTQPPPLPRSRVATMRAHPAFAPLASWLAAFLPRPEGHPPTLVSLDALDPPVRDRVVETALRAVGALDPTVDAVARHRARQIVGTLLHQMADRELAPAQIADLATQAVDLAIDTYRHHLAYGSSTETR